MYPGMMGAGQQQLAADPENPQSRTLWIGDVEPWMDENHIGNQFRTLGVEVRNVKLIRDKAKGAPVGYGFVEFQDQRTASQVFSALNGKQIPGSKNKHFKLNWASHGGGVARAQISLPNQS
mmetsp:Transcript_5435/g.9163  ORF Transcript_5435/g.9163 Transcript_5435/m.9163 type:complete len:121 (-) Transcript_5435:1750-2112(-)